MTKDLIKFIDKVNNDTFGNKNIGMMSEILVIVEAQPCLSVKLICKF